MSILDTCHAKWSPFHPQANAQTERFNVSLRNALKSQLDTENWAHRLAGVFSFAHFAPLLGTFLVPNTMLKK